MLQISIIKQRKKFQKFYNFFKNLFFSWGIFKQIIEIVKNQQDGTFVLMKTLAGPKPMVKLIKLPPNVTLEVEEETEF